MFYGAIVVTVGAEIVGHRQQGLITRSVTPYLQLAGVVALVVFAIDLIAHFRHRNSPRWFRWYLWGLLAITLAAQYWLHPQMSVLIDVDNNGILDRATFRNFHRWYLRVSTIQWAASLFFGGLTLGTWRECDELSGRQREESTPISPHHQ